jgi:hypothetical protein
MLGDDVVIAPCTVIHAIAPEGQALDWLWGVLDEEL